MKVFRKFSLNNILYNNTLLKFMSVIIAIVMWAYIIIIIDAPTERTFRDVAINTVNEQVLSDNGYSIERLSVQTASVKIEGSRKIIAKFDSDNIAATLDFSDVNMSKLSSDNIVTVNLKVASEFGDVVSFTPSAIDVHIEPTKYKELEVQYTSSGQLYDDYILDDVKLSQDRIRISGASNNLDNVDHAVVILNLINTKYESYMSGDFSENCDVLLYNSDNRQLSDKESRWIWNSLPEITVSGSLYKVKEAEVLPKLTSGVLSEQLVCEPSTIKIYGNNEQIENYTQIETMPISKSTFEDNSSVMVKLNIPSWMKTVDNISEVQVSANSD